MRRIDPDEGTDELVRLLRSKQWSVRPIVIPINSLRVLDRHGLLIGAGVRKSDSEVAWLETLIQTTKVSHAMQLSRVLELANDFYWITGRIPAYPDHI